MPAKSRSGKKRKRQEPAEPPAEGTAAEAAVTAVGGADAAAASFALGTAHGPGIAGAAVAGPIPAFADPEVAAASTGIAQPTAQQRQAALPQTVYAIKCSRKSELIDYDGEWFVDCYGEECDDAEDTAQDSATAADGSWMWDSDPQRALMESGPFAEGDTGFAGGGGQLVVFRDLAEADRVASDVWLALLLAVPRPSRPVIKQLEEQAFQLRLGLVPEKQQHTPTESDNDSEFSSGEEEEEEDRVPARRRRQQRQQQRVARAVGIPKQQQAAEAAARAAAAVIDAAVEAGDPAAYAGLVQCFGQVSGDGLVCWQGDIEWWDDPYASGVNETTKNVVRSKIKVEVVRARLV